MKKIERQRTFVSNHLDLFQCPVCSAKMTAVIGNSLTCPHHHQFDFNRHGYLHFLNGAANTEYDRDMFLSRRKILTAGLFQPLITAISHLMPAKPLRILDVGTGEGTPLYQLAQLRSNWDDTLVGFDISKPGVTLATQLPQTAFFCVADLRKLPFSAASFDYLLELFSPSDYQEFNRVLKSGGTLIKVIPNADYLIELRHRLYESGERNYHYDNSRVIDLFRQHYPASRVQLVRYQFRLPAGMQTALLEMTPLHWGVGAKRLSAEELQTLTQVTVDVSLLVAQKN